MKIIGPREWVKVPDEAKALPFKKTFTKFMKKSYIKCFPTKQSENNHILGQRNETETDDRNDLLDIFLNESTDSNFLGFELEES